MTLFPSMVEIVPPGATGLAKIEHFEVSVEASQMTALRPGAYVPPGRYARLVVGHTLMMTDTHHEHRTNYEVVEQATGHVFIAGLGLGMVVHAIAAKPDVSQITIVEKYPDVTSLVAPTLPAKAVVLQADAFEHTPAKGAQFQTIYFDIWPHITTDNLPEMTKLHRRYRKFLAPGGWMGSWCRDLLRTQRRQEQRHGGYFR